MKVFAFLTLVLTCAFHTQLNAQLPEKAEDISPLLISETIPDIDLTDVDGQKVSVHKALKEKPAVILVYRGGWCPYCTGHLAEVGQREAEILELGYQIIAVSPDAVAGIEETGMKEEVNYQIFSDASGGFIKALGIAFKAPERYEQRLFKVSDGENNGFLPVPSVFVTNTSGEILFEYINPNYRARLSADLLLAVLKTLKTRDK